MLSPAVQAKAKEAVEARFRLRDKTLSKELEDLAALANRSSTGEERDRIGVRLRLICERDLFERAQLAWAGLRKAHQESEKVRRPHLQQGLLDELDRYMRIAAVNLATQLRAHASDFPGAFTGSGAINAEWIARLRERAFERQAQNLEDYVYSLRRGVPLGKR